MLDSDDLLFTLADVCFRNWDSVGRIWTLVKFFIPSWLLIHSRFVVPISCNVGEGGAVVLKDSYILFLQGMQYFWKENINSAERLHWKWGWNLERWIGEILRKWLCMQYLLIKRTTNLRFGGFLKVPLIFLIEKMEMPSLWRVISWTVVLWNVSLQVCVFFR